MFNNFKEWFSGLSYKARTGLIGGICIIAAGFFVLSSWLLSTDYQVLFSDLEAQDGSAIISELDRMKVPYQLADDGKTILVDKDNVYKTRLKLMGKGVNLKGTVGFEIFNESDFGMTDFAQRINYQRALQGEIARTIMALEEVESARVHLVVPESGFLKKSDQQTKASITIATKPGHKLSAEQVLGIQRLVAAAVPDIDASAVTILDNRGVALTKNNGKEQDGLTGMDGKLAIKQQTEQYFVQKIAGMLDKTYGPGKAIVSVDVLLDYDSTKITREDVLTADSKNGDGAIARRKKHSKREEKVRRISALQNAAPGESAPYGSPNEDVTDEIEYQHGRQIEQVVSTPGAIKRLSVGVIVPNNIGTGEIDVLSKVIASSVGIDKERGDALAVHSLNQAELHNAAPSKPDESNTEVAPNDQVPHPSSSDQAKANDKIIWYLSALFMLLVIAAVWVLSVRRRTALPRMTEAQREKTLKEIQAWLSQPQENAPRSAM